MTRFEISQMSKSFKDSTPSDKFELRIEGDGYMNARAIIYSDWIAEELARDLGIEVKYMRGYEK